MKSVFIPASNRQKKVLKFFELSFDENSVSRDEAGVMITRLFSENDMNRDLWNKYLYLTNDFGIATSELLEYDNGALDQLVLPVKWDPNVELQKYKDEILEIEYANGSPFDIPHPSLKFKGIEFVFTGKFDFGSRVECQEAVLKLGGVIVGKGSSVSLSTHVVVVGGKGSPNWKRGKYGRKIEDAVIRRNEFGTPVIVPESHWVECMKTKAGVLEAT